MQTDYPTSVFHLAIPCRDLDETEEYYVKKLGFQKARRYDDRITLNMFGDQVVCHLNPEGCDDNPQLYPRHFGRTFRDKSDFDQFYQVAKNAEVPFFKELFVRFEGKKEEHLTFFLIDPSNNLIEIKYYHEPSQMY